MARTLEVEVVEVDGVPPAARRERPESGASGPGTARWRGGFRSLDSRWWPLWLALGGVAAIVVLAAFVVFGVALLLVRLGLALVSLFRPGPRSADDLAFRRF